MIQPRFVFGGGYWDTATKNRKFGMVKPCGDQPPYTCTSMHDAEKTFRLVQSHAHMYAISEDLRTLTLLQQGDVRSEGGTFCGRDYTEGEIVTAPQTVALTDDEIKSIRGF